MKNFRLFSEKLTPLLFASITLPCAGDIVLGDCISQIYTWSLTIVGIAAFVQIVYGGWQVLTAFGNTGKVGEAMSRISNAVLGIVLLFSSYLILKTINPNLVGGEVALPNITVKDVVKNTGGVDDLTKIDRFDVSPKVADISDNTELAFDLDIRASVESVEKLCAPQGATGGKSRSVRYQVFATNGGNTTKIREFDWLTPEFGTGTKVLSKDFNEKLMEDITISDPVRYNSVAYYTTFSCLVGSSWKELNKSSMVTVRVSP
ncbi:MAG: hypothetical protein Q7S32_03845 [bacterium]|nr:hypothetical protein [bacterium]